MKIIYFLCFSLILVSQVSSGALKGKYIAIGSVIEISTNKTYFQFSDDYEWLTILSKSPLNSNHTTSWTTNYTIINSYEVSSYTNYTTYYNGESSYQNSFSNELSIYRLENEKYVLNYQTNKLNELLLIDNNYSTDSSYDTDSGVSFSNGSFSITSNGGSSSVYQYLKYTLQKYDNTLGMVISYDGEEYYSGGSDGSHYEQYDAINDIYDSGTHYSGNYSDNGGSYNGGYLLTPSNNTIIVQSGDYVGTEASRYVSEIQLLDSAFTNNNYNQMVNIVAQISQTNGIRTVQFYRKKIAPSLHLNQEGLIILGDTNQNYVIQRTLDLGNGWVNYLMLNSLFETNLSVSIPFDHSQAFYRVVED